MIVGDPKQSIYRWRGGKFNQFINLIYGQTNPFHFKPDIEKIDSNYRSSREIINFNSDFFMGKYDCRAAQFKPALGGTTATVC